MVAIAGILMMLFGNVFKDLFTQIGDSGLDAPNSIETYTNAQNDIVPITDNLGFWVFIAFLIGLIFIGIYADYHPALIIIGVLVIIIAVFLSAQYVNIYDDIKADTETMPEAGSFTLSSLVFGRQMPIILLAVGVISLIIIYGKRKDSGGF